jgi:hypothetical protein
MDAKCSQGLVHHPDEFHPASVVSDRCVCLVLRKHKNFCHIPFFLAVGRGFVSTFPPPLVVVCARVLVLGALSLSLSSSVLFTSLVPHTRTRRTSWLEYSFTKSATDAIAPLVLCTFR